MVSPLTIATTTVVDTQHFLSCESPKPHYDTPKYPLVLCHGFSGFDQMFLLPVAGMTPFTDRFRLLFKDKTAGASAGGHGHASSSSSSALAAPLSSSENITRDMGVDNRSIADKGKYLIQYWNGVKSNLESHGCTVLVAKVPPFETIERRASVLDTFIRKSIPQLRLHHHIPKDEPVKLNLVAHSMGGLDCRYLIFQQQKSEEPHPPYKIMSLTTISTPHRGTSAADFALNYFPTSLIRNNFPSIFELSTKYASKFNSVVTDDPSVKYFSYGAQMHPYPGSIFLVTWKIISDKEGPNDGMVSLRSCKWGNFVGYLDDVDHADLINWMGLVKKTKMALGMPNFNPKYFYLEIADNLAKNGL